jgi:adenylate kinase
VFGGREIIMAAFLDNKPTGFDPLYSLKKEKPYNKELLDAYKKDTSNPTEQIILVNPGELFRHYFYDERLKTIEEIEEMVISELREMPRDSIVVLHWHYAVRRPGGFIPQIGFSQLKRVARIDAIEQIVLLVVETTVNVIRDRRMKDHRTKKRELSNVVINEEIDADEIFLIKHQSLFSQMLGGENITTLRLVNDDLHTAQSTLYKFLEALLSKST